MGLGGGPVVINVGDTATLPDGSHARVTRIEGGKVYGTRRLDSGLEVAFWTGSVEWSLLRDGIIPNRHPGL